MEGPLRAVYPLDNTPLFEARPTGRGYVVDSLADPGGMEGLEEGTWALERPTYDDLLSCFLGAGILDYSNIGEFEKRSRVMGNLRSRVVYSPDTNLLYHRFFSNHDCVDPGDVVVADSVRNEIEAALNYKYDRRRLGEMLRGARYEKQLARELINRRMKASRKAAYLALREYRRLRDVCRGVPASGETGPDRERNDLIHVRSLREYGEENPVYPVVLTCDSIMTDLCEGEGLEYFLLRPPTRIPSREVSPGRLVDLIRLASCVMGFIRLGGATIQGEFRGKAGLDELKVTLPGARGDAFGRDLRICRGLMKLGIQV